MNSSDSTLRKAKRWPMLVSLLVGLVIGAQTVRIRMAEGAVRERNGAAAAAIRPQNGWGLALLAEEQFKQGQLREAAATSRRAVTATPLAVVGLRTLARAQAKLVGPAAGEQAWQAASMLGWRDRHTQLWAAQRALFNGEAEIFAMRGDAVLRTGDPDERLTEFVRQAVAEPRIRQAFVSRLVARPPWRLRFFQADRLPAGPALNGIVAVILDLSRSPTPPSRQELRDAMSALILAKRYPEAISLDRQLIRRQPSAGSLIDDSGFENTSLDYRSWTTPFDWNIDNRIVALDSGERGRSLVVLPGGSSAQPAWHRYLALPVGRYEVSYAVRGDESAGPAVVIRAVCDAARAELGRSDPQPLAGDDWQTRGFAFAVQPGCGLVLIVGQRTQNLDSDAFVDDIVIRPAS